MGWQYSEADPTTLPENTTVSALIAKLVEYNKEIGCDGKKTGAHTYPSSVGFRIIDADDALSDLNLELGGIDIETHLGCGCWTGVTFVLTVKRPASETKD